MLSLSRKIKLSIERNSSRLIDKTYNESTIKELLIDLREIGNEIKSSGGKTNEPNAQTQISDQSVEDFIDICNCIAHSNRLRGVLENNIRKHIEKIQNILDEIGNSNFDEATKVERIIDGDSIVAVMVVAIYAYLNIYDKKFDFEKLAPILDDKANISLCIISLLQDTVIRLEKNKGVSVLHILSYEGKYRLYCRILDSSIHRKARERAEGVEKLILGFPVIITSADNIDDLQFDEDDEGVPKGIETFRDEENNLHARFIDIE